MYTKIFTNFLCNLQYNFFNFYLMPFSNSMASKRKTSSITKYSNYDSDDSEVVIKRRSVNVIDDSVSDINIPNTGDISKYIMITENEYIDQGNSFQFIEISGPQYHLSKRAKPIEYFNLFFTNSL